MFTSNHSMTHSVAQRKSKFLNHHRKKLKLTLSTSSPSISITSTQNTDDMDYNTPSPSISFPLYSFSSRFPSHSPSRPSSTKYLCTEPSKLSSSHTETNDDDEGTKPLGTKRSINYFVNDIEIEQDTKWGVTNKRFSKKYYFPKIGDINTAPREIKNGTEIMKNLWCDVNDEINYNQFQHIWSKKNKKRKFNIHSTEAFKYFT